MAGVENSNVQHGVRAIATVIVKRQRRLGEYLDAS